MQPVYLLDLAAQQARWATVRQATVAGNIANANTPGYTALDIQPFAAVLDETANADLAMARTAPGHLDVAGETSAGEAREWTARETGTPVALDKQLVLADEANRTLSLDTAIVRTFHRMFLAAVRS